MCYSNAGEMRISSDDILAGEVGFIEVVLDYQTLTEDAINTSLAIALPSSLLKPPESIVSSVVSAMGFVLSSAWVYMHKLNLSGCGFSMSSFVLQGKLATSQCSAGQEDMHTCELEPIFSVFEKVGIYMYTYCCIFSLSLSLPPSLSLSLSLCSYVYTCTFTYTSNQQIRQVVIRFPVQDVRGDESDDTVSFTIANKQNDTNTDNNVVNVNLAVSARASVTFSEL